MIPQGVIDPIIIRYWKFCRLSRRYDYFQRRYHLPTRLLFRLLEGKNVRDYSDKNYLNPACLIHRFGPNWSIGDGHNFQNRLTILLIWWQMLFFLYGHLNVIVWIVWSDELRNKISLITFKAVMKEFLQLLCYWQVVEGS